MMPAGSKSFRRCQPSVSIHDVEVTGQGEQSAAFALLAILSYLHTGRPSSSSRRLFLCHRLPVGQPMTLERLRGAVRRIMRRSGLSCGGPHRLRHSFATRLHARGASLKEVADVLGHQHFDTTAIYARVNLSQLRKVALPWPRTHL